MELILITDFTKLEITRNSKNQLVTSKSYSLQAQRDCESSTILSMTRKPPCFLHLLSQADGLIFEFVSCSLASYLQVNPINRQAILCDVLATCIIPGLLYLHSQKLVHNNLDVNCVLGVKDKEGKMTWKLTALEKATRVGDQIFFTGSYPTPRHMMDANTSIDVFALGCFILDIFMGPSFVKSIQDLNNLKIEIKIPESIPYIWREAIRITTRKNESDRCSLIEFDEFMKLRSSEMIESDLISIDPLPRYSP